MKDYLKFLRGTLKNPFHTGALFPSSRSLAEQMLAPYDLNSGALIVEVGPGTGALTLEIARNLKEHQKYIGLELNHDFLLQFQKRFPDLKVVHENAQNLSQVLAGKGKADFIICSLPWTVFPEELQDKLLHELVHNLKPDGHFCTYSYLHATALPGGRTFKRLLDKYFHSFEKSKIIWGSLPPALVYYAQKSQNGA